MLKHYPKTDSRNNAAEILGACAAVSGEKY